VATTDPDSKYQQYFFDVRNELGDVGMQRLSGVSLRGLGDLVCSHLANLGSAGLLDALERFMGATYFYAGVGTVISVELIAIQDLCPDLHNKLLQP
jgi:hypothetical protein